MADKKNTFYKVVTAALCLLLAVVVFFAGYFTYYFAMSEEEKIVSWALDMIGDKYVMYDEETKELKEFTAEEYVKALIEGLRLDPYSEFYTSEEFTDIVETSQGNRYGIGVTFLYDDDSATIYSVTGNSPAERAGVRAGGQITAVEYGGVKTSVDSYDSFSAALSPIPAETLFTLYVRYGDNEAQAYSLKKESFKQSYVRYADADTGYVFRSADGGDPVGTEVVSEKIDYLPEKTAYIKYESFMYSSAEQFGDALAFLFGSGNEKLILDLRGNGGGYMDVLTEIAGYLLNTGKSKNLVAVAEPKSGKSEYFYTSANRYDSRLKEVAVLADGGTASASECLIGALIHYGVIDDAHLVVTVREDGRAATFGKGIMQTTYVNPRFGGALKLTTAYIYWPDGETCIHGRGISTSAEGNSVRPADGADKELERAAEILA